MPLCSRAWPEVYFGRGENRVVSNYPPTLRRERLDNYHKPEHRKKSFNCLHCGAYAVQIWGYTVAMPPSNSGLTVPDYEFSQCTHCEKWVCWYEQEVVHPAYAPVPFPHPELPNECRADYMEARDIVERSPKAAAALIRLAVQKLMIPLGEKGDKIDEDIQSLVDKGLDPNIQGALDYCRLVGNKAVHPGTIDFEEQPEVARILFQMINTIVEDRIARPKRMGDAIAALPADIQKLIHDRAAKAAAAKTPPKT